MAAAADADAHAVSENLGKVVNVYVHSTGLYDIKVAMDKCIWASTAAGNLELQELYMQPDTTVLLYFTKFESGKFYGIAKMTSLPVYQVEKGTWEVDHKWAPHVFTLYWVVENLDGYDFSEDLPGAYVLDIHVIPEEGAKKVMRKMLEEVPEETIQRNALAMQLRSKYLEVNVRTLHDFFRPAPRKG